MKRQIRRALISVSDKSSLSPLIEVLQKKGVEIIASGGTKKEMEKWGVAVTALQEITGNPPAFDGRVKSLSFEISAGLLFCRDREKHRQEAEKLGIKSIDLVVCNFYPFLKKALQRATTSELMESIDIGGPTMIRAAAKNYQDVCVLTHPTQYEEFIQCFEQTRGVIDIALREKWALAAWQTSAHYESIIAVELQRRWNKESVSINALVKNPIQLRYGENPGQKAWAFGDPFNEGLLSHHPLQGKALSYNNLLDADAACRSLNDLIKWNRHKEIVVIIKHGNPCGQAASSSQLDAIKLAWAADPVSSFGGIIAVSSPLQVESARWLMDKFIEVVIAPAYNQRTLDLLREKKNLRVLVGAKNAPDSPEVRSILGGWLVQQEDSEEIRELQPVTNLPFPHNKESLARFGIVSVKHLKSNAISLVASKGESFFLIGAGMGGPNRLAVLGQAIEKAKENGYDSLLKEAVLASDAFFPFADSMELAYKAGIRFVVQPGGSIRDKEVIDFCNRHSIMMAITGRRNFRH